MVKEISVRLLRSLLVCNVRGRAMAGRGECGEERGRQWRF